MITDIRLSISESSKLFGISQRTIRRAIAAGELEFTLVQGRYKISFDSLLRWSQTSTLTAHKRDTQGIGQYVNAWKISHTPVALQATTPDGAQVAPTPIAPPRLKKATAPTHTPTPTPSTTSPAAPDEPTLSWD